jgi:SET domain-containing protein
MKKFPIVRSTDQDWTKQVKVKKSGLPKAGKGLFALQTFRRGEIICEYEGELVPWSECERRSELGHEGYVFFFSKNRCVDAYYTPWAVGRYANDARGISRIDGLRNNAQYVEKMKKGEKRVFIVASRTIHPGEEILVHYGDDYWRYLSKTRELFLEMEREKRRRRQAGKDSRSGDVRKKS